MSPDRWQQVASLYGAALALSASDRAGFLRANCGDDEALRAEVESLLSIATKPGLLDSTVLMDRFKPAAVVGERFRIVRWIGQGGMGDVYEAEDLHLGGSVALKTIRPDLARSANSVERFKREIQVAKKVTHPNVCRIYDIGFHPSPVDPNAQMFLTMELLEGETLARRLTAGPMTTAEALPLIQELVAALGAAHESGVIHRDFKSGNVMLTRSDRGTRAVIMDFGLATSLVDRESGQTLTRTGELAGTPEYMAPEQLTGGPITPATDIYALGIVMYEMLTGKRPFRGQTPFEAAVRRLHEPPQSPRDLTPNLEPRWEYAILRCLSLRTKDRFQNTTELLSALSAGRVARGRRPAWRRSAVIGGVIAIMAVAAVAIARHTSRRPVLERTEWQQITDFSDSATAPALSPDGRMLAFKRGGDWFMDPGQIYLKLLPDGQPFQITHDSFAKMAPVFSPDGLTVAYSVRSQESRGWQSWEIWQAPVLQAGGEPRLLLRNAEGLTWVDKQRILFSEMKGPNEAMAVVTSTESRTSARDVYVPRNPDWMAHFSALSPDRNKVLIVEMSPGSGGGLNNADFFPCRLAPFDGSSEGRNVGPVPGHCIAAGWSPDGRWMYFSARADEKFHLWRQKVDSGELEQITSGPTQERGLAITPDGRFAITSVGEEHTTVWVHDAQGERQISGEGAAIAPNFAPDGKAVYYRSGSDLWETDLRSGRMERVLPGVSVGQYALSPDGKALAYTTSDGSLWYGPIDRQTAPRLLASRGVRPEFTSSGNILFRISDILYRIHPDGTELRQVPGNPGDPVRGSSSLSPDEAWGIRGADNQLVFAEPRSGGPPITLCDRCIVHWSLDGKFFWITLRILNGEGVTGVFRLKDKAMLPKIPQAGILTKADLMKIPGAQIVPSEVVSPAPDGSSYAFVKKDSRWNLYRIPLP